MQDEDKTKEQLMIELHELRQRLAESEKDKVERNRAEEALRERDIQFKKLSCHVPGMIFQFLKRLDGTYCVPFTTEAIKDIFGCSPQDVREDFSPITRVILSEDLDELIASIESSTERMTTWQCEYRVQIPGRPIRWMLGHSTPEQLADGSIIWYGFNTDITERKRAEDLLHKYAFIVGATPDLMSFVDTSYRYQAVNEAYLRAHQKTRDEIIGHSVAGLHGAEVFNAIIKSEIDRCLAGEQIHYSAWFDYPGLGRRFVDVIYNPYRDRQEAIAGVVVSIRDITERKRAEEERRTLQERLHRAEKMEALGTLAGGVAHDLNNVLGIVVGYSELLLDDLDESSSARSEAMEILKSGNRAAAIVQDLLTLARRGVPSRKVLNLNNIVMECQQSPELAQLLSYHPHIKIKTDFEVDLLNISGSSVHLVKSLFNLVSNATEAMPNVGNITIKTRNHYLDKPVWGYDEVKEGDYVVLTVSDTGEGIPATDLKRIFEPFYTKKVMGRSGTGLGLAVVWGTVKDHLGYVNVESKEGKGTTFTLYFPVTREEISQEEASISAAEYMGNGESILVVDDVNQQRELAERMLTKLNYKVTTVSSGEEAVEYIKQHTVDLVVLDMIMDPGIDGLDTYRKIREIHPRQKAIIVSGFSETERVTKAQDLGAGAYVKKPYMLEKLGLAVRKELDRVT